MKNSGVLDSKEFQGSLSVRTPPVLIGGSESVGTDVADAGTIFDDLKKSLLLQLAAEDGKPLRRVDILGNIGGTSIDMFDPPKEELVEKIWNYHNLLTKGKKKQSRWNSKMDEILINVLMDEYNMGNKKNGRWAQNSLKRVANEINARVDRPDLAPITNINVRARMTTFKEQYTLARNAISKSGFVFNNETKCVDADPIAWEEYIKAFPKAEQLRGNPIPYYLDFAILLGDDVANGGLNVEGSDDLDAFNTPSNEPSITLLDDNGGIEPPINNSFEPTNPVRKSTPKRNWAKLTLEVQHIGESMKAIASAASDMAMAFKLPDYSTICNEISQIPGLTENEVIRAMDMFWKNKELPNFFLGLAPSLRRGWTRMKLGNNEVSYDGDLNTSRDDHT